ncbi:MAG: hypothetical protein KKB81_07690 [Candidatus Margulisbacteria bacterium]|nr:hypothetical protein [Candidatus Margulisiibacteriota bacterium]MBU1021230.1 hypothetical protein [Candidatus Margulisiibacteriota bacterium]MBU1729836.1 hypothetical protein [Candidatus Margulisiibacteriota bacterium]MBU1955337.1 hypothetical protein [Candidatus Margulisiibacteriota bacterium]
MKLIEVQQKLNQSGLKVFSKLEFRRLLGISKIAAQKLLERYTKRGVLVRLKGGLYVLKTSCPSLFLIANRLYEPSYVSFETALSFYRLIPETVYTLTSATTKVTREFVAVKNRFKYHKIKKKAFTGYRLTEIESEMVLFAEKEKALADYLYFVFLKKKKLNDRLQLKGISWPRLNFFLSLFDKPGLKQWVKNAFRKTA